MLHSKKSQSILQWYNSLTTKGDVNSLAQFTDGSHFYEIVASLQPFTLHGNREGNLSESVIFSETSIACNEIVITSVEEEAAEEKMETSVSESGNADPFVIKESDHTDTQKKYDAIRKFINDFYHVESSSFIDYGECQNGKELELAKVAVFLLSAMVQNLLSSEDKVVYNTTLLEPEVQENIRECLSLVLMEKDMGENQIKKSELHKILSRPASYKGTPIRKQPSRSNSDPNELTDGVKNVPKKRKERTSAIIYEDVQDSPLKNLLESPKIQYKAAIFKKESELAKLRGALVNEENKVIDLTLEKKNLNDELEKRKKELEFYKKQLELQREALCEKEDLSSEELKLKKIEEERVRKLVETQKEEIKQLKENNEALQEKMVNLEKKLEEQGGLSTFIEENTKLKNENQILNLENENKSETIKTLNEKVTNLENDLKMYQQMYHDFSAPNSRRELRSPNVPESLSTIIYADEQSSRETLERKEHDLRQDPETKDERIKRLGLQRKSDASKNKNLYTESQQVMVDRLLGDVRSLEKEKNILKEKLEYYQLKFGSTTDDGPGVRNLNSVKKECDRIGSSSDDSGPSTSKNDNKGEGQLWANVPNDSPPPKAHLDLNEGKIQFEKSQLTTIIRLLERKNCIAPALLSRLKENCNRIRDSNEFCACLRDLASALRQPVVAAIVTRRARAVAAEEAEARRVLALAAEDVETVALISKNRSLEQELEMLKSNMKSSQVKISKKEDELKIANKKLEASNAELMKEIGNLKQEIAITQEKYTNMEMLAKKKDHDVKKALGMYSRIMKFCQENKVQKNIVEENDKLKRNVKELKKECLEFEKDTARLLSANNQLEGQLENLRHTVKELSKEKKELQHKLWIETSGLSDNIADRDAVIYHYLSKSKYKIPEAAKDPHFRTKEEQRSSSGHVMRFTRYAPKAETEPSMSNSVLASSSIPSGFFQGADEDDFLNESSLAEIHNGGFPEGVSQADRLQEIQRRNTLCPPHLQSCYPLEIQDMTPSERKYYDPGEVSFDLGRKSSIYNGKRDFYKKLKSEPMEDDSEDSDDSDDSSTYQVRKRKLGEIERVSVPVAKKQCRPTAKIIGPKEKPSTPLKRAAAFVRRQATFKTPVSVQRLMSMPRKNKAH